MKKIPLGISDFEQVILNSYYYVDKTLFIKEILENGAKATLIPRPRRFGKTLNMSMLKSFFEKSEVSRASMFDGLDITKYVDCMKHQGQYPVIFLSFKDAKKLSWLACYEKMVDAIKKECDRHSYLEESESLSTEQKKTFESYRTLQATQGQYELLLQNLCHYLALHYKKNPIILIDEYDSPVHAGFVHNYYDQVVDFMRSFLGAGLKDNSFLSFGVITGILRIAKESIFSGLNNLHVCSLLNPNYADKFGLTEQEVAALFKEANFEEEISAVKNWYNGYTFGKNCTVYNPWSIMNFIANKATLQPYWINTSDNAIIKELLTQGSVDIAEDVELLLRGESVEKVINENIIFSLLHSDDNTVWSFLLFSGYLSCQRTYLKNDMNFCSLKLPNKEILLFYRTVILEWVKKSFNVKKYHYMLQALTSGNIEEFKTIFYDVVKASLSSFDIAGDEPERFYHVLVLGMLVSLREHFEVNSNRESGYGRYDVLIIPRVVTPEAHGIIIEFKKVNAEHPTLEKAAAAGFKQIEDKAYETELRERGIQKISKIAIAFEGRQVLVQAGSNQE